MHFIRPCLKRVPDARCIMFNNYMHSLNKYNVQYAKSFVYCSYFEKESLGITT